MQRKPEVPAHTYYILTLVKSTADCKSSSTCTSVTADYPDHLSGLIGECDCAGGDSAHLSPVPAVSLVAQVCCITASSPALLYCSAVPQRHLHASWVLPVT